MKVYIITKQCIDPYYEDDLEGHTFDSQEKADKYIEGSEEKRFLAYTIQEVE